MASLQIQEMEDNLPHLVVTSSDTGVFGRESPVKEVAPPSPTRQPVILKSHLHKKGKRFKGWHQRYFEIQGQHMYYYKNSTKSNCLGEIDLSTCIYCGVADEATFGAPFEIQTTIRTHVMSARSATERVQWVKAIKSQMEEGSEKKFSTAKPKRWKTFRNAFKRQQKTHGSTSTAHSKITKKKSIMDRFRLRKSSAHPPLQIGKEFDEDSSHQNRPLSLTEDEFPKNTLAALVDIVPSRSLPATPLAKKRLNSEELSPPESPTLAAPGTPDSAAGVMVEVHVSPSDLRTSDGKELVPKIHETSFTWDIIRQSLESEEAVISECAMSYDQLPEQSQEWMKHSSALEQLRAFLAASD